MVKFINAFTGSEMWVHESRIEEYKAAGHKLAANFLKQPVEKRQRKKATAKK